MLTSLKQRCPPALAGRTIFFIASVAALFSRFFHHGLLLGFYQDDFFYYLKVAENLALHRISSFDNIHLTNGYHPLWLLTLALLRWRLHGVAFFLALQTLTLASVLLCYLLIGQIFRTLQIPKALRTIATFIVSMQALLLLRYGMEVTLALPLGLWLIRLLLDLSDTAPPRRIFWLAILGSLTILARLDAILLVSTLLLSVFWSHKLYKSPRPVLTLLLGLSPMYLYLVVNYRFFHVLAPVSGLAKQMKTNLLPSASSILGLILPFDRLKIIFMPPCLLLLAAGLVLIARSPRTLSKSHAAVLLPALIFPILQILVLSILSDWPLWPWYFYSFVFSSVAAIVLLIRTPSLNHTPARQSLQVIGVALSIAYILYIGAYSVFSPNSVAIYTSSRQLATYMDAHPGTYAMGDQAGVTGYLSSQPLIQLEGLVMDADYLQKLKRREPLRQIMEDYGVRYYVTLSSHSPGSCLPLREPGQAGPHSPVSQGVICSPPLATFHRKNVPIYVFDAHAIQ